MKSSENKTFIQILNHMKPLKAEDWVLEFQAMKALNINEVVLQWSVYDQYKFWGEPNTEDDIIGRILKVADIYNVRVHIGLGFQSNWFTKNKWNDLKFLNSQLEANFSLVRKLFERYQNHTSFVGWYIPFELGDWDFGQLHQLTPSLYLVKNFYKKLGGFLREIEPKKKISVSVFFEGKKSSDYFAKTFKEIFEHSNIDIVMLQLGYGVRSWSSFEKEVKPYIQSALNFLSNEKMQLWLVEEVFIKSKKKQNGIIKDFQPIDSLALRKREPLLRRFSDNIIYFEFFHYLSPYRGAKQKQLFQSLSGSIK